MEKSDQQPTIDDSDRLPNAGDYDVPRRGKRSHGDFFPRGFSSEVIDMTERQTDRSVDVAGSSTEGNGEKPRDHLAIKIEGELGRTSKLWEGCCIYKVPHRFQNGNEKFYKPRVVTIGPYHYFSPGVSSEDTEIMKLKYVEHFLSRSNLNLDHCLRFVRAIEERARRCYVKRIYLSRDQLVEMMLVDGIFVLELMLKHQFPEYIDSSDRIFHKPRLIDDVFNDLLLIENQIPFFVLEGLYEQVDGRYKGNMTSVVKLTHAFFKTSLKVDHKFCANHQVEHFVDFIRCYYVPQPREDEEGNSNSISEIPFPPSVTILDDSGVKFKAVTANSTFLLNIQFIDGQLRIPNFRVDDWTETLFRNLIAFEQCHAHKVKYISQFTFLMGCMIKTSKDADLLTDHQIISSMLGSNEDLSTLFNHIGQGVGFGQPNYYFDLCRNLNAYCTVPWHRSKAILKRDYFNTPWKAIATVAAIILLLLTLTQTISSVIPLFQKEK